MASQTGIFKNRIPLLVTFALSNQSMHQYYMLLWQKLMKKVHFTVKTTGPAGQPVLTNGKRLKTSGLIVVSESSQSESYFQVMDLVMFVQVFFNHKVIINLY